MDFLNKPTLSKTSINTDANSKDVNSNIEEVDDNIQDAIFDNLTIDEAFALTGVSKHTIRNWIQKKYIRSFKSKGRYGVEIRLSKDDLIKYIENNSIKPVIQNIEVKTVTAIKSNMPTVEITESSLNQEYIKDLKDYVESLKTQLAMKDSQISLLLEKLTQANTLALNAQQLAGSLQDEKASLNLEIDKNSSIEINHHQEKRKKFLGIF